MSEDFDEFAEVMGKIAAGRTDDLEKEARSGMLGRAGQAIGDAVGAVKDNPGTTAAGLAGLTGMGLGGGSLYHSKNTRDQLHRNIRAIGQADAAQQRSLMQNRKQDAMQQLALKRLMQRSQNTSNELDQLTGEPQQAPSGQQAPDNAPDSE